MSRPQKTNVYKANATALGDMAQPLRDAATKMLESADRVHNTVYDFEWEGEAKTAADGRADRELVQDRAVATAQLAMADAYDNAAKIMQPMIDSLKSKGQGLEADDFAVSEDWVVTDTYDYDTARKLAPLFGLSTSDVDAIQTQRANTATTETTNLQKLADELGTADANAATAINNAKGDLDEAAPGASRAAPPGAPAGQSSERTNNQRDAFTRVYGREPTSANDWRVAATLDPNSYDPRNRGVPPQIQVARIRPVPGQGLVRVSQWIPQLDVLSGPGRRDFGNDRGADPNFDPTNTKVTTYIDYDNGLVVMRQNPSIEQTPSGGPGQVKVGVPNASVTQTPDGAVRIRYDAANPFAPDIAKSPPFPIADHPWTVNGDLVFTPGANGVHVDGTRGNYPSLEVYQDFANGPSNTVLIDPARTGNSYGPIENLPFHHDVGIGGRAFEPFDRGGWNPQFDVQIPLPSTDFGPPSNPPSVPPLPPTVGTPA